MSGGANGVGVGELDALALAIGSAVLDVLQARGIATQPKHPSRPRAVPSAAASELETRRSRWVVTPETYLGASAAVDPAGTLERLIAGDGTGGAEGHQSGPGHFLSRGGDFDPAHIGCALRSFPRRSNYRNESERDVSDEVRGGYGD